jgi:hypothetical protein
VLPPTNPELTHAVPPPQHSSTYAEFIFRRWLLRRRSGTDKTASKSWLLVLYVALERRATL